MDVDRVLRVEAPHVHLRVAAASVAWDLASSLQHTSGKHVVARVLRGQKSRTARHLFDEWSAALQFPRYFGENWDALNDCLADLQWLPGDAYVLLIADGDKVLDKEPPAQLGALLKVLEHVAGEWSKPKANGLPRPARPFHVVLQCSKEDLPSFQERLHALGLSFHAWK
jgi:hypothetical protein